MGNPFEWVSLGYRFGVPVGHPHGNDDDGHTFGPDSLGGGEVPTVMMPTLSELNEIKNAESSGESSNAKAQKKTPSRGRKGVRIAYNLKTT